MTKELSKEILKKLEDFCESVKTALEVTEPEKKCKNFEYVKYSATGAPNTIIILFKGDEKVTEINNDGPIKRITIRREFESYLIKQNGEVYYIDDLFVDASNYDTINRLVKEHDERGMPIIKHNTCNDEPIVDTLENITKKGIVINKTEKEGAEKYIFQLGNDLFHIKKVKNVYSYKGIVLHPRHAKIIDKVVNEYNSQFDKNRCGFDCERGHVNSEEKKDEVVLYRGRKIYDILDNSYILGDFRDVNHRYFMLVDTNLKTIRIATTDEGAFIEDDDDIKTPLGTKETYLVMLMISKYLENKNK